MGKRSYPSKRGYEKTSHCSSKMKNVRKWIEDLSLFFNSLEKMTLSANGFLIEFSKLIKIIGGIIILISTLLGVSSAL